MLNHLHEMFSGCKQLNDSCVCVRSDAASRQISLTICCIMLLSFLLCSDVNKIREGIGDKIASFLQWSGCCISGIVMGIVFGWKLGLVIVAVSPLLVIAGGLTTYVSTFDVVLWCCYSFLMISDLSLWIIFLYFWVCFTTIFCIVL